MKILTYTVSFWSKFLLLITFINKCHSPVASSLSWRRVLIWFNSLALGILLTLLLWFLQEIPKRNLLTIIWWLNKYSQFIYRLFYQCKTAQMNNTHKWKNQTTVNNSTTTLKTSTNKIIIGFHKKMNWVVETIWCTDFVFRI